jgi:hypothetical protein
MPGLHIARPYDPRKGAALLPPAPVLVTDARSRLVASSAREPSATIAAARRGLRFHAHAVRGRDAEIVGKLSILALLCIVAATATSLAFGESLPQSPQACISLETPKLRTQPLPEHASLAMRLRARQVRDASWVLCMNHTRPAPGAARILAIYACRNEWKTVGFVTGRYDGGSYTTYRDCLAQKTHLATTRLAQAQRTGARACSPQLTKPSAWATYPRMGFVLYFVEGRC